MIKVLLVGFGKVVKPHLATINAFDQAELVGVVRRSHKETGLNAPLFNSLDEALGTVRPDLAIIATPHALHYEETKLCLEAGCHVLSEKPLALAYEPANELVALAREKQRLLVVGLQRRYEGFAQTFRKLHSENKLGRIILINGLFAHRFETLVGWRLDSRLAGLGIVDDSAYHLIDILLCFAGGRVSSLSATVCESGTDAPHSFACFFRTENDVILNACGSYLSPAGSVQEEISVYGSNGSLFARRFCKQWDANPPAVFFKSADGKIMEDIDISNVPSGRQLPLLAMLNVLTGRQPKSILVSEAEKTLETHRVIELIKSHCASSLTVG